MPPKTLMYASPFVLNREDGLTTADLARERRNGLAQPQKAAWVENSDSFGEQGQEFNSHKYRTNVVFCHASIRDYLRNPGYGKMSRGDGSTPVGVDIVRASVNTLSDKIDQQQKQKTIVLLCQIFEFADLEMFETGASPYPLIFFIDRQTMDLIISLFADQECVNTIHDLDTREWVRVCIQEPAPLFVSLGLEVASRWLVDSRDFWNPHFHMVAVWAVVTVLNGNNPHDLRNPPFASVDTVLEVARWAQFEEKACWHHHVGACLRSLGHVDTAIGYLSTALALEPIWGAKIELAKIYWRGEINHEGDVKEIRHDLSKLRNELGSLHIQLGEYSNATNWFMASIELWDFVYIDDAVSLVVRVLIASQCSQYETIMQLLEKIDR
ncbi:hypothetical protein N7463_001261 [Penicillium fimorum]|uniref:Tetratricopeptide-like helical n=1 Tax=Penicillium fimorum TaxID=1882269 RepID=A0A9W9Y873_9EURO|nr:hypothetical protein N7463_001261 [Penicillium fimorum]